MSDSQPQSDDRSGVRDPLVHIGYHKTGSTWLQQCLFDHPDSGFIQTPERSLIPEEFVLPRPLLFDVTHARQAFAPLLSDAEKRDLVPAISHERLSGNPHSGGYDNKEVAERLKSVFPSARILIVIREQRSMIASTYKQFIREGGSVSVRRYMTPPASGRFRVPLFNFEYFEYDRLIQHYRSLFGEDRVLVLPFEEFKADSIAASAKISAFAGAAMPSEITSERRNVGMGGLSMTVQRWTNFWFSRDTVNPAAPFHSVQICGGIRRFMRVVDRLMPKAVGASLDARMKKTIAETIGDRYADSNARTSAMIDADLSAFGYKQAKATAIDADPPAVATGVGAS